MHRPLSVSGTLTLLLASSAGAQEASAAAATLLASLTSQNVAKTAAQLAELPGGDCLPAVVEHVIAAEPDKAWLGMRVLHDLCAKTGRSNKNTKDAASRLAEALAAEGLPSERHRLIALAIGAMGPHGAPAVDSLLDVMASPVAVARKLDAAVALGCLGSGGVRKLRKQLKATPYLQSCLTFGVVLAIGKEGKSLGRTLNKIVTSDKSVWAYLMCRVARTALAEQNQKQAVTAWKKRQKIHTTQGKMPSLKTGLNAVAPADPIVAMVWLREELKLSEPPHAVGLSLPKRFEPKLGKNFCLGDALQCFALHVATQVDSLAQEFAAKPVESSAAWKEKTGPLLPLLTLLGKL